MYIVYTYTSLPISQLQCLSRVPPPSFAGHVSRPVSRGNEERWHGPKEQVQRCGPADGPAAIDHGAWRIIQRLVMVRVIIRLVIKVIRYECTFLQQTYIYDIRV